MIRRICPHCNAECWSADSVGVWVCCKCGGEIPPVGMGGVE